ncbi:RICIN domain-containing protein, partial [Xanthovirga aplysinae]|uniref:RICIN domain-containing protein n=1 Tax=Xanthovirga aplysinae TaxID=2529853 RepID=UPI0012BC63E7
GVPLKNVEGSFEMLSDYESGELISAEYKVTETKDVSIGLFDPIELHLQSVTKYKDCIYWIHSEYEGTKPFMVIAQRTGGKYNVKKFNLPRFMDSSCSDGNEVNHPSNMQLIGKFLMISIEAEYNPLDFINDRDSHHMFVFYDLSDPYNPVLLDTRIEYCESNTFGGGIAYHPIQERYYVVTTGKKVYRSNQYLLGDSELEFEEIGELSSNSGIKTSAGNNLIAQEDGSIYSVAFEGDDGDDNKVFLRRVINPEGEIELGDKITYNLGAKDETHFRWGGSLVVHGEDSFTIIANERELHSGGFSDYSRIREWPVDPALPYPGKTYRVRPKCSAAEDFSLQVWSGNSGDGENVQMQSKYEDWEYWKVVPTDDNEGYLLKNAHTGKYISIEGKSTSNNANVHQWKDGNKNDDNNTLRFEPLGNGFFVLRFRHSNRVLAIQGSCGDIARQTNVRQEEYKGYNDHKWEFIDESVSSSTLSSKVSLLDNKYNEESKVSDLSLKLVPNPSSSNTLITYLTAKNQLAIIQIMNLDGSVVFETQQLSGQEGEQKLDWLGVDNRGNLLPKGIYICRLQVGEQISVERIVRF